MHDVLSSAGLVNQAFKAILDRKVSTIVSTTTWLTMYLLYVTQEAEVQRLQEARGAETAVSGKSSARKMDAVIAARQLRAVKIQAARQFHAMI